MPTPLLMDDPDFVLGDRIPERRPQEEAVELCFRKRERPLVLDRVLGREQEERVRQVARLAVDGYLLLGHRLEERRLRLRHRAVDLVDEDHVGEDRPGPELEVALLGVEEGEARHIGRLEVRRALDARRRRALDRVCDRAREHGLGSTGNVLEEHMAPAQHRGEDELDLLALAVDDRLDVVREAIRERRRAPELALLGRVSGPPRSPSRALRYPSVARRYPSVIAQPGQLRSPRALATLRAMSRTFLVLTVVLVALAAAGCMGGGDTSQEEFAAQVVETRNRTDAALEHMTRSADVRRPARAHRPGRETRRRRPRTISRRRARPDELEDEAEELVGGATRPRRRDWRRPPRRWVTTGSRTRRSKASSSPTGTGPSQPLTTSASRASTSPPLERH